MDLSLRSRFQKNYWLSTTLPSGVRSTMGA